MKGPLRVGREISFNTKGVGGWWRGERSGVQILPAPESAPRANEGADNPFILEFPILDAGAWPTTIIPSPINAEGESIRNSRSCSTFFLEGPRSSSVSGPG